MSEAAKKNRTAVPATTLVKTATEFALAGKTRAECADFLGMDVQGMGVRLSTYRKAGLVIPKFASAGGGGKKLDLAALQALVDSVQADESDESDESDTAAE